MVTYSANIFSYTVACLFTLLWGLLMNTSFYLRLYIPYQPLLLQFIFYVLFQKYFSTLRKLQESWFIVKNVGEKSYSLQG